MATVARSLQRTPSSALSIVSEQEKGKLTRGGVRARACKWFTYLYVTWHVVMPDNLASAIKTIYRERANTTSASLAPLKQITRYHSRYRGFLC